MIDRIYDGHTAIRNDNSNMTWPKNDTITWNIIVHDYVESIKPNIQLLQKLGIIKNRGVIQAGGHCGVYPVAFTEFFDMIFTFEPNPISFHCLVNNCQGENIIKMNVALGKSTGRVKSFSVAPGNTGMNRVKDSGDDKYYIPMIALDSLALTDIGLIELDLEGYEYDALLGAKETIARNKPVFIIENATDDVRGFFLNSDTLSGRR
jgi:FkbM family methyltransferase